MREELEMVTASLMQNMVQIRKSYTYFVTKILFVDFEKDWGALGVEIPHGGAIWMLLFQRIPYIPQSDD